MRRIKLVLIAATLLVASAAEAQFSFGVKGGVNITKAKFDGDVLKSDNITGYYLGPMMEFMLGRGGFGLDLALLYSQKGFESELRTVRNSYIEVPANLKFKLGLPLVNPYISAGPYIDFRIAGDKVWDISGKYESIAQQLKSKSFGAGLNFAVGADVFDRLQVGLNYSIALTDNYKTFDANDPDSYRGKIVAASLSVAFIF
ncbi:MAG: PorT family protein [Tannerella sp.]|jgi:hypothetical protein|nr:PorT family protein [Tannerella sp.]